MSVFEIWYMFKYLHCFILNYVLFKYVGDFRHASWLCLSRVFAKDRSSRGRCSSTVEPRARRTSKMPWTVAKHENELKMSKKKRKPDEKWWKMMKISWKSVENPLRISWNQMKSCEKLAQEACRQRIRRKTQELSQLPDSLPKAEAFRVKIELKWQQLETVKCIKWIK